jgi:FkbM family methyltransferase
MLRNIARHVALSPAVRRVLLPLFARCNPGDIRIRHHYTRQKFKLHSFRHKGYWFHGSRREHETMQFFAQVIVPGQTVFEIGGHIGYLSLWFAELVGDAGRVIVFEPGQNNLPYLRANVADRPQVEIVELAASDQNGVATFFEEALTGQNNSLLSDYARFAENRQRAFSAEAYQENRVRTVRLDDFVTEHTLAVDFLKIDVEGAESLVLAGATGLMREQTPALMVEATQRRDEVCALLESFGYQLFSPSGRQLGDACDDDNICALHPEKHSAQIARWLGHLMAMSAH